MYTISQTGLLCFEKTRLWNCLPNCFHLSWFSCGKSPPALPPAFPPLDCRNCHQLKDTKLTSRNAHTLLVDIGIIVLWPLRKQFLVVSEGSLSRGEGFIWGLYPLSFLIFLIGCMNNFPSDKKSHEFKLQLRNTEHQKLFCIRSGNIQCTVLGRRLELEQNDVISRASYITPVPRVYLAFSNLLAWG